MPGCGGDRPFREKSKKKVKASTSAGVRKDTPTDKPIHLDDIGLGQEVKPINLVEICEIGFNLSCPSGTKSKKNTTFHVEDHDVVTARYSTTFVCRHIAR